MLLTPKQGKRRICVLSPVEEDLIPDDKRARGQVSDIVLSDIDLANMEQALPQVLATLKDVDEKLKKLDKLDSMEQTLNGLATSTKAMQSSITLLQTDVTDLQVKNTAIEDEMLKSEARFCAVERKCAYLTQ